MDIQEKTAILTHMKTMRIQSLLFRLSEILSPICVPDTPKDIKQLAGGFSSVLHQYHVFHLNEDSPLFHATLQKAQNMLHKQHPVWDIYANDKDYWYPQYIEQLYGTHFLDTPHTDDKIFMDLNIKHRSYAFIVYEILKPYFRPDLKDKAYEMLHELCTGFAWFYDVVEFLPKDVPPIFKFRKYSEIKAKYIMEENGYDLSNIDHKTMQNYVLATGVCEDFIQTARNHYQKAYDISCTSLNSTGGRPRLIKGLCTYCDDISNDLQTMFS